MKKSLFLCVFADWIECSEAIKEWGLDVTKVSAVKFRRLLHLVQGSPRLRIVICQKERRLVMQQAVVYIPQIVIIKNNIISVSPNRGHVALYAKTLLTFLLMCHKIISVMQKLLCFFTTTTTTPLGV